MLDRLHSLYRKMYMIRRFENQAYKLYSEKKIGGFCHLYNGQEAIVVGIREILQENDSMITAYRDHGHMMACQMDPRAIMAELLGKQTGSSKGKGGSMHMFSVEHGFYGGHGIVGAQVPLGTGIAFKHKYHNDNNICVTFMGDGAANQGQVYEAYNISAIYELPILYIIENNKYGMGTHINRVSKGALYKRSEAFGVQGHLIDGQDIITIIEKAKEIIDMVRQNKPMLIEFDTYRYKGHSMSDPALYRSKMEIEEWKQKDPLVILKQYIIENGNDNTKEIEKEVNAYLKDKIDQAINDDDTSIDELYTDVI